MSEDISLSLSYFGDIRIAFKVSNQWHTGRTTLFDKSLIFPGRKTSFFFILLCDVSGGHTLDEVALVDD